MSIPINNQPHTSGANPINATATEGTNSTQNTGIKQNLISCFEKIKGFFKSTFKSLVDKFTTKERNVSQSSENFNSHTLTKSQNDSKIETNNIFNAGTKLSEIKTKISDIETEGLEKLKNDANELETMKIKWQCLQTNSFEGTNDNIIENMEISSSSQEISDQQTDITKNKQNTQQHNNIKKQNISDLKQTFNAVGEEIKTMAHETGEKLKNLTNNPDKKLEKTEKKLQKWWKKAKKQVGKIVDNPEKEIEKTGEKLQDGLEEANKQFEKFLKNPEKGVKKLFNKVGKKIKNAANDFVDFIDD